MSEVVVKKVDFGTVVTMRTIKGQSVQEVADHFGITWDEAREAIRSYGLVVAKSEKPALGDAQKGYVIDLVDKNKIVAKKEKVSKV